MADADLAELGEHVVISPWLEELIRQYGDQPKHRVRPLTVMAVALAGGGAVLSPWLFRLDRAAYPPEPEKRQALDLCSRSDPTFLRFLASDRASCYRHFPGLIARAGATAPEPGAASTVSFSPPGP